MDKKNWSDAKDLFGRTLKTAHITGTCISCKSPARKKDFSDEQLLKKEGSQQFSRDFFWEEYKRDGLCQECCIECYIPLPVLNQRRLNM